MELYYKVGQVLETGANIVTNYGSLALLQSGATLLQGGAGIRNIVTNGQTLLQIMAAWRYYKVGQELIQSGAGNL